MNTSEIKRHSANAPKPEGGHDDFFVGYLPTPPSHRRAMTAVITFALLFAVAMAGAVASAQRDPGTGTWKTDKLTEIEGIALFAPYAMLRTADAAGNRLTLLLVSEGKFGATDRLRPFDGQAVRVRGTRLEREGRRMMEISSDADAVTPIDQPSPGFEQPRATIARPLGARTLRGEFIDPKCYIGAMKPGGGKTHKACAQLCVGGGIPPMFVTRNPDGAETYYLIVDGEGEPANEAVLPYLGDPVQVSGELEARDDLRVFRIDTKTILRI